MQKSSSWSLLSRLAFTSTALLWLATASATTIFGLSEAMASKTLPNNDNYLSKNKQDLGVDNDIKFSIGTEQRVLQGVATTNSTSSIGTGTGSGDATNTSATTAPVDASAAGAGANNITELDVTSPPIARQTGNPIIQQSLWIGFQIILSVLPDSITDQDGFLLDLDVALEQYLESSFLNLIANEDDSGSTPSLSSMVQLRLVDLNCILVEQRRALSSSSSSSSLLRRPRDLAESSEQWTIDSSGSVDYSVQVDGGRVTPEVIQQTFSSALQGMLTQARLEEAIGDAGIEGVVRVDQATVEDATGQPPTREEEEEPDPGATGDDVSSLLEGVGTESDENSGLQKPSTLSIVFGFFLVGIATLGLVGYGYIYYRKRKKRLRKKKQMQETITFSSTAAAAAAAAAAAQAASNNDPSKVRTNNGGSSPSRTAPMPPSPAAMANPMVVSSMILTSADDDYSEASTAYKGLESSIGSEDPSDSFAKELQLAASLDEQAWDEFQRRKRAIENKEVARASKLEPGGVLSSTSIRNNTSRNNLSRDTSKKDSLLGGRNTSVDDEDHANNDLAVGIEADVDGNTSWTVAKSFPYGDEIQQDDDGGQDRENGNPASPSRQWEPYNSALPPSPGAMILEEKKDEASPMEFFARQLQNIELDMARYGGVTTRPRASTRNTSNVSDDNLSTSEILSEVEEITRYVHRYERRRNRKTRREMELHDRLSVGGSSAAGAMSIGMDGRVYDPHRHDNNLARGLTAVQSSLSSMSPPSERGQLGQATSYVEREVTGAHVYGAGKRHEENRSFISDDDEDSEEPEEDDESFRGRRLGISPYSESKPDEVYPITKHEKDDSTRTATTSSRAGITSGGTGVGAGGNGSQGDYRYGVGYGFEGSGNDVSKSTRSSSSRLAHLRANDAIIDSSSSDVNPSYDATAELDAAFPSQDRVSNDDRGSIKRINLRNQMNKSATDKGRSPATNNINRQKRQNNNTFDRLRGLFEQKTNAQPEPIYPPGEHWQYGVSKK